MEILNPKLREVEGGRRWRGWKMLIFFLFILGSDSSFSFAVGSYNTILIGLSFPFSSSRELC